MPEVSIRSGLTANPFINPLKHGIAMPRIKGLEVIWSKLLSCFVTAPRMAADSKYQKEEEKCVTVENLHVFGKN
jgi:hypothetical protein